MASTEPPASEGIIQEIRLRFSAEQFRAAAELAHNELDGGTLSLPDDPEGIRIVSVAEVEQWLLGLAIRVENGGALR